jgi:hypothetical protein
MKKAVIGLLVLGGLYFAFAKPKSATSVAQIDETNNDVFAKYNNRIVVDANGYWMIIRDGKYFGIAGDTVQDWQNANPSNIEPIKVNEDIWIAYNDRFGGTL